MTDPRVVTTEPLVLWESYLTQPMPDADPADMRTRVTWTLAD